MCNPMLGRAGRVAPTVEEPEPPEPFRLEGFTRDEIIRDLCRELTRATGRRVEIKLLHRVKNMRNQMCPCGSGKKFKSCCEKKGRVFANVVGVASLP